MAGLDLAIPGDSRVKPGHDNEEVPGRPDADGMSPGRDTYGTPSRHNADADANGNAAANATSTSWPGLTRPSRRWPGQAQNGEVP